jgi:hypothetical protein
MRLRPVLWVLVVTAAGVAAGCSGLNSAAPPGAPAPTSAPVSTTATGTLTTSTTTSTSLTLGPFAGGYGGKFTIPLASTIANLQVAMSLTAPAGVPVVQNVRRLPRNVNAANINPFGYVTFTPSTSVTLPDAFLIVWKFPPGSTLPDPEHSYVAIYDPNDAAAGWTLVTGPATFDTDTGGDLFFAFPVPNAPLTLIAGTSYQVVLFSTTSTLATPTPLPTASPTARPTGSPSPTPTASATATPTASPTPTGSPSASPSPTPRPTVTPTPTATPTSTPTPKPTATPTPTPTSPAGFTVQTVTASGNGTVTIPVANGSTAAFAVIADNGTLQNYPVGYAIVQTGTLPLWGTMCQTNPSTGQCLNSGASIIGAPFTAGQSKTFSVLLLNVGQGPIVDGTVTVTFGDGYGHTLGSASVTVNTQ